MNEIPELSVGGRRVMIAAKKLARSYKHDFITTEHILYCILDSDRTSDGVQIMSDMEVDITEFKGFILKNLLKYRGPKRPALDEIEPSGRVLKVLSYASCIAQEMKSHLVDIDHMLLSILVSDSGTGNNLFKLKNIDVDNLYEVIFHLIAPQSTSRNRKRQKARTGGSTDGVETTKKPKSNILDKYAVNLTQLAKDGGIDPVIGRDGDVKAMIQILSRRTKNNPVLIGEAGVGKTAVVELLAHKISANSVPPLLQKKQLYTLDLAQLVAGTIYRGQFEERLKDVVSYVQSHKDIILFIDELHMLVGAGSSTGAMDASNILKPALARGKISCIGATTTQEYKEYIEDDGALERRFQTIYVDEPTTNETIDILKGIKSRYEEYHNVKYSPSILKEIVFLCERYIVDKNFPDKAIDVLDEIGAKARVIQYDEAINISNIDEEIKSIRDDMRAATINQQFDIAIAYREQEAHLQRERDSITESIEAAKPIKIDIDNVREMISEKCCIPVSTLSEDEASRLSKLSRKVKSLVIGQNNSVDKICNAIKRSRAGVTDPNKPICSLLFMGPTGVGKTHLARSLGNTLFDNNNFKQFDMSEYSEPHSISKLIGSPPGYVGYGDGGKLTEYVRHNPYCVLLFDEIEKASEDIVQIFLQMLEYGCLTDSDGLEVNFKNTIIIMTSNVGSHKFDKKTSLGFNNSVSVDSGVLDELKKTYAPEFINRIDEIIIFGKLNKSNLERIVKSLLRDVKRTIKENNNTTLTLNSNIYEYLLDKNTDLDYGARPLRRVITEYIETPLADFIIKNKLTKCKKIHADLRRDKIMFTVASTS
jgi:ATP-dependent Clp protease ATP-binding subunit ClpC